MNGEGFQELRYRKVKETCHLGIEQDLSKYLNEMHLTADPIQVFQGVAQENSKLTQLSH